MLILILIDIEYLQNVAFSFEKGSTGQNLSSDSNHLIKYPPANPSYSITHLENPVII